MESGEGSYTTTHTKFDELLCLGASIFSSDCKAHFYAHSVWKIKSSGLMLRGRKKCFKYICLAACSAVFGSVKYADDVLLHLNSLRLT